MPCVCELRVRMHVKAFLFVHLHIHSANSKYISYFVDIRLVLQVVIRSWLPHVPHLNIVEETGAGERRAEMREGEGAGRRKIPPAMTRINFSRTSRLGIILQKQSTASMKICSRAVEVSLSTAERSSRWMRWTHFTKSLKIFIRGQVSR